MIANGMLSHTPPPSWTCFTLDGSEAASNSNIAIGGDGPTAVDLYMEDDGDVNEPVGHRRWLLFPSQETMGTGSVTASNGFFFGANAIWVIGGFGGGASQPAAWPPEGFVPFQVVYDRWSYSRPNGDFSGATVTMTQDGNPVVVDVLPIQNGFGDNTLVWEPRITKGFPGGDDQSFTVRIEDVVVNFVPQTIAYTVTVIDPSVAGGGGGEGVGEGGGEGTGDGPTGPVTKVSGCGVSAGGGSDEDGDMAGGSVVVFCLVAVVLFWRGRARRRALG